MRRYGITCSRGGLGLLLALCLVRQAVGAPPVTVQARLTETEIYVGESTTLELRIQGVRNPDVPDVRHPEIEVTKAAGQSFSNASYTVINGQVRQVEEMGYVARYLLRPRTAGTFHLPPLAVVHEGQTYQSNAVQLTARRPAEQDHLLVAVRTEKPAYVVGESVTLTLEVSIRKLLADGTALDLDPFFREQPPHLEIPWFESLGDWKTTDVKIFAQPYLNQQRPGFTINEYHRDGFFQNALLTFAFPRQVTQRATAAGTVEYFTYQLHKQFQPQRPGTQVIAPVVVKASLPTQVDARGRALRTAKFVASSTPLTVDIRPVPSAGQPASFSGAVGRFQLQVEAQPTTLKVGDPLTLKLTIRGDGLLDTVHPPALDRQTALVQGFKLHTDPPTVTTDEQAKTFTYTLRPRSTSVREVPAIEVATFDPTAQRFHVLRSTPIPLRVAAATTLDTAEIVTPPSAETKNVLGQELTEGILANYDGDDVLTPQTLQLQLGVGTLLVFATPPVVYLLVWILQWRAGQRQRYPGRQRAQRAYQRAGTACQRLRAQPAQEESSLCEGVHRVLTGYISDKLNLSGAGFTVDDMTQHLQRQQVASALIEQVAAVLHRCDSVRYAPGTLAVAQLTGLIDEAEAVVQRLEESGRL